MKNRLRETLGFLIHLGSLWMVAGAMPTMLHGEQPQASQATLRTLQGHSPFVPPTSRESWEQRASDLREQLAFSVGLHPMPMLDPVQPVIHGKIDCDDYTIEKCVFESLPGFYVTGNLYRPTTMEPGKKVPGVLCPHGHWDDARFYDLGDEKRQGLLASGAERFESAARNHIQARCVQLARMGCIVFHWDMIGYCDSTQISFDRAHRFANQPLESEVNDEGWLLFSPLAEANCQSIVGLQALATSRAVDMLLGLPEVDPQRIAITGASGGGTQSFLGAALDDRIRVAFPAVMVSTGMQGGCTCENACYLRIGTGNVEIAATIAPRVLGMTAADDWTKTMPQDGFPELQQIYQLFDAPDHVALFPSLHFGHNFNHVSRVSMYGWMSDHLELGFDKPVLERDFTVTPREQLAVWDAEHPQPPGGEEFERRLMKHWAEATNGPMQKRLHGDKEQQHELAEILRTGWRVALGMTTGKAYDRIEPAQLTAWEDGANPQTDNNAHVIIGLRVGGQTHRFRFPFSDDPQALVPNPRLAASYTYAYNLPRFAKESIALGKALDELVSKHSQCQLSLSGSSNPAALAAAGLFCLGEIRRDSGEPMPPVELDLTPNDFRFASVESIVDPNFLPGSVRYWDLPGLVSSISRATIEVTSPKEDDFQRLAPIVAANESSLRVMSNGHGSQGPPASDAPRP